MVRAASGMGTARWHPTPSRILGYASSMSSQWGFLRVRRLFLLLFSSPLSCLFLPMPCGLSTISINNLGNCLLLLKSIPVLLLLSAGPEPEKCCDGVQMKQRKWNGSRREQNLSPHRFRWGYPKPTKYEHQIPAKIPYPFWSSSMRVLWPSIDFQHHSGKPTTSISAPRQSYICTGNEAGNENQNI